MKDILKPARYINREWNAVHKDWDKVSLRFALCFPDIYEIGMSHLGMKILYGVLNKQSDIVCERFFAPWIDMEGQLRVRNELLSSLETRKPLKDFDVIGFSLQYEMNYVDVLNIMDLGGVKVFSRERTDSDPIVLAGGPCAINPEPMRDFIDAFVIGEAEDIILDIAEVIKSKAARQVVLQRLSEIPGVYVPSVHKLPKEKSIKRNFIKDMDRAFFPLDIIVPYIQVVHDRIGIEIMRGCPNMCKFCQACRFFHPVRLRSVDRILEIAAESVKKTGYDEISLLSLSSGDYPYIEELVSKLESMFKYKGVKVSLPSLRVRSFDEKKFGSVIKKAGLTFAPEAGSDRLRKLLNKNIDTEKIIETSNLLIRHGWKKVKLYFMIGLPEEGFSDLDAIIELASRIKNVNLSISSFIPKPHSGFDREGMDNAALLYEKMDYLKNKQKEKPNSIIKIDFHSIEMSSLEAVLSRGDRKICDIIFKVWEKGARLQAWGEHFNYELWMRCFEELAITYEKYLSKEKDSTRLIWNFIET